MKGGFTIMDYSVTTPQSLLELCVANDWLGLANEWPVPAYEECCQRLLYANENGFSIGEIASIIWACSEINIRSWHDVFHLLCAEHEKYISALESDSIRR